MAKAKKQKMINMVMGNGAVIQVPDDAQVIELVQAMEKSADLKEQELRNRAENYKGELVVIKALYKELIGKLLNKLTVRDN